MKKKVSEIHYLPYGENHVCVEPSRKEIKKAVRENNLEKRGFQKHRDELVAEWNETGSFEAYCDRARRYHAQRTAFFVVNGWQDHPITLTEDDWMIDGLHRLLAAKYLGDEEVEVEIEKKS
jgi:hypothetical protein